MVEERRVTKMTYKTEQENFWAGDFGLAYIDRNNSEKLLYSKVAMWAQMLRAANSVASIRELGCNIGLNLLALNRLHPEISLSGIEINEEAVKKAPEQYWWLHRRFKTRPHGQAKLY